MKWILGAVLFLGLIGCATLTPLERRVVARVNGDSITVEDLTRRFERGHSGHLALLGGMADRREFLEIMIDDILISQEGYRIGLNNDPGLIEKVNQYRTERIIDRLYDDEVRGKVIVSDGEIEKIYSKFYGRALKMSLIRLRTESEAEKAMDELKRGRNFGEVARERSIDPSASSGGRSGFITWGMLDPVLEEVLFSLGVGDVSGIVKTRAGYYILRLSGEENLEKRDLNTVKNGIKQILERRHQDRRYREFVDELKKKHGVDIDYELMETNSGDGVMLRIGGEEVLKADEFQRELEKAKLHQDSPSPEDIMNRIMSRELLKREALDRGYDGLPDIVSDVKNFEREAVANNLYREIVTGVRITDLELQGYYESHRDEFTQPDRVKVRHILVSTEEEAEEVLRELKNGMDFAELAKERSTDFAAAKGGDLGYIVRGTMVPELETIAFSLKVGEISGIIKTRFGCHILKVEDIQKGKERPLTEVRVTIEKQLLEVKRRDEIERWIETLRERSKIKINEKVLSSMKL